VLKQGLLDDQNEREIDGYLDSLNDFDNAGYLKLAFSVKLDPSFTRVVQELAKQRLKTLEILAVENNKQLQEQYKYLQDVVGKLLDYLG